METSALAQPLSSAGFQTDENDRHAKLSKPPLETNRQRHVDAFKCIEDPELNMRFMKSNTAKRYVCKRVRQLGPHSQANRDVSLQ